MLMRSALFWGITQRRLLILYRRFGTAYRSHLQRTSWPLKMGPTRPETSVKDYHSTLRYTPEKRRSQRNFYLFLCIFREIGATECHYLVHFVFSVFRKDRHVEVWSSVTHIWFRDWEFFYVASAKAYVLYNKSTSFTRVCIYVWIQ
jgi:hypothetical protein